MHAACARDFSNNEEWYKGKQFVHKNSFYERCTAVFLFVKKQLKSLYMNKLPKNCFKCKIRLSRATKELPALKDNLFAATYDKKIPWSFH